MSDRLPFGVGHPRHYDPVGFNPLDLNPADDASSHGNPSADSADNTSSNVSESAPAPRDAEPSADSAHLQGRSPLQDFGISGDLTFSSISPASESRNTTETELPALPIAPINSGDSAYGERPPSQIKPLFDAAGMPTRQTDAESDETKNDGVESGTWLPAHADDFAWLSPQSLGLLPAAEDSGIALESEIAKTARHRAR
ncbi:hypothetical protein OZX74_00285 [Bifidobacterium sp. ESL0798]|uniref:hypothetical protein n=1 Tax=Bifidobacterium sp. ESL0798 TaxID=2983235 RepID=UPI0023F72394|nr:hypothetical protein [Bifidobacterium sp. ESL0798]WEV74054.1 hypothetical protein OZX74_00285 [Bifidobacterium sp. ESL0798]